MHALGSFGRAVDMRQWLVSVDRVTSRVGLLLSGRPDIAIRLLAKPGPVPSGMQASERAKDLVGFAVASGHFNLRDHLDIKAQWHR